MCTGSYDSSMDNYIIRRAKLDDIEQISQVQADSWQVTYKGLLPDYVLAERNADYFSQRWPAWLTADGPAAVFVAVPADNVDTVVGIAACGKGRDDSYLDDGQLYMIYLDPRYFRQSIGRLLLSQVQDALIEQGYSHGYLWVLDSNISAQKFYDNQCWMQTDITKVEEFSGHKSTGIMHRKKF